MSALSKLILLQKDNQTSAALQFGFEREGTTVYRSTEIEGLVKALLLGSELLITSGASAEDAIEKIDMAREAMSSAKRAVPILYFGNAISREEALKHGANEFAPQPAFLRDIVTISKLMATPSERRTQSISGELNEHFGLYYFVRALGVVRYTGVLGLIRGTRRGEIRFYEGEVTAGQSGSLYGLAAIHQLLLWVNARFDLKEIPIVHRKQIPLSREDLLRDCERFLEEIHSVAGGLSPSEVLECVPEQETRVTRLPVEVKEVLSLFDGTGTIADIIEDSPYRVFETLRIACRLLKQGFIVRSKTKAPKRLMKTALAIEEWLVGNDPKVAGASESEVAEGFSELDIPPKESDTWSDLIPSLQTAEELAQIVPATHASGEITSRAMPSEKVSQLLATTNGLVQIGELVSPPKRERFEEAGGMNSLDKIFVHEESFVDSSLLRGGTPSDNLTSTVIPNPIEVVAPLNDILERDQEVVAASAKIKAQTRKSGITTQELPVVLATNSFPKGVSNADEKSARKLVAQNASDAQKAADAIVGANAFLWKKRISKVGIVVENKIAEDKEGVPEIKFHISEADVELVDSVASFAKKASAEATHFSADEEDFFSRGIEDAKVPSVPVDNFEDLDEEYDIPTTLWGRFMSNPNELKKKK